MTHSMTLWLAALAVCFGGGTPLVLHAQELVPTNSVPVQYAPVTFVTDDEISPSDMLPPVPTETTSYNMEYADFANSMEMAAPVCDAKKMAELKKKAASAYKPLFFDNDFSYLCDPCYDGCLLGEDLKRMCVGDCGYLDIGGEYRARYHHEQNMKPYLNGVDDDFLLHRLRLYANYQVNDNIRVYAEMLHAISQYESAPPRPIDENYWELQNMFVDTKLLESGNGTLYGRFGRQELLYGSQRLVSPLDWANIRRRFDGLKLYYRSDAWDIDGFLTRPIRKSLYDWDSTNQDQSFYGIFSTYKKSDLGNIDLYWLGYENNSSPFRYQTLGSRVIGEKGFLLYEMEGAYQTGEYQGADHDAGFFTIGLGHQFQDVAWKPKVMVYYDWASGDSIIGNGFDQLFPLGHAYLGWMDLFARRNIEDFNVQLTAKPCDPWTLIAWWHVFNRQDTSDVPYTVTNAPYPGYTPAGSRYLGQELDFMAKCQLTPHSDIIFGYSHFFTGTYFRDQNALNPAIYDGDADFFYTQFTLRF
ncbi:alginate export family protein [Bremerella cremea]|uniref:alginate export family protein n=1 Tax=Bremerella cremea TaxID=1031537 RepID=UPI0031E5AB37